LGGLRRLPAIVCCPFQMFQQMHTIINGNRSVEKAKVQSKQIRMI